MFDYLLISSKCSGFITPENIVFLMSSRDIKWGYGAKKWIKTTLHFFLIKEIVLNTAKEKQKKF